MHIPQQVLNRTKFGELYVGNRKRLATATSISFIDSNTFVTTSLLGLKMYVYRFNFEDKSYTLIDSIDTTYNGKLCATDLIDYHDGLIVCSNCNLGNQSIYKFENNKLSHYIDIKTFFEPQFCHGVKFYKWLPNMICASGIRKYHIDFINYETKELVYRIEPDARPQDLAFVSENRIAILGTNGEVMNNTIENSNFFVKIMYYDIDIKNKTHELIDTFIINDCRGDSIYYFDNHLYFSNQFQDEIVVLKIENDKLQFIKNIEGYSFPHGLAIESTNNLLGVTNYGDNSIRIIEL